MPDDESKDTSEDPTKTKSAYRGHVARRLTCLKSIIEKDDPLGVDDCSNELKKLTETKENYDNAVQVCRQILAKNAQDSTELDNEVDKINKEIQDSVTATSQWIQRIQQGRPTPKLAEVSCLEQCANFFGIARESAPEVQPCLIAEKFDVCQQPSSIVHLYWLLVLPSNSGKRIVFLARWCE